MQTCGLRDVQPVFEKRKNFIFYLNHTNLELKKGPSEAAILKFSDVRIRANVSANNESVT